MTSSLPLVSGIVAAYNYERYLAEALESALTQDYPPDRLELIVVDDGSTDGTPEIARRYAAEFAGRIRYVRQDNAGPAAATTRGLQEARGEMITLLDADDVWLASRTRLLVDALLRNPAAGLAYGDMEVIDTEGRTLAASWLQEASQVPFRGRVVPNLLQANFVMTSSLMVRASLRERFCPIPPFFATQDWPIVAGVAEVAEIEFVPAVLARYRRHGANLSNGKHSPSEVAALLRRDVPMRRWMLANLRASYLTVEDLVGAVDYFWHTLLIVARVQDVRPESFVEVSEADRMAASGAVSAGEAALARADFILAASHFAAAVGADPFDPRAREGLEHAKHRLVVPEPRAGVARCHGDIRRDYHVRADYTSRDAPRYFVDLVEEREGVVWRRDVYNHAATVATRLGANRIVDLGAGSGSKLMSLHPSFEILGIDYGPNVEIARRRFATGTWREHDLDRDGLLPLSPDELEGSVVVCANVIEQLTHPEFLLGNLRELLPLVGAIVMSTPERDLTHGPGALGPPPDECRVREWNVQEFAALLEAWGFEHGELELTRSGEAGGHQDTIIAVLYADAERAERLEAAVTSAA
jgi:glycosyltransferase involved in cell wall biosynthesis